MVFRFVPALMTEDLSALKAGTGYEYDGSIFVAFSVKVFWAIFQLCYVFMKIYLLLTIFGK